MIYYKIVREWGKELESIVASPPTNYKIGEWTVAPEEADELGYGLLVYDSEERAKEATFFNFEKLFTCEVRGIYPNLPPLHYWGDTYPWRPDRRFRDGPHPWPQGTVMVTAVKLLEEVEIL